MLRYCLAYFLLIGLTAKGPAVGQSPELVLDINPGSDGSAAEHLTGYNGQVYFSADDGSSGSEVWRSDGTPGGTILYHEIFDDFTASRPHGFTVFGGNLYYAGTHNIPGGFDMFLFRSDGSDSIEIVDEDAHPIVDMESPYGDVGDYLYFAANDGVNGNVLYRTLGTGGGATLVSTVNNPINFANLNGTLLFSGNTLGNRELWHSDGTPAGSAMITEINPGGDSSPYSLTVFGGHVYFGADDGTGLEVWRSDGTDTGTTKVKDISSFPVLGSFPQGFTEYDNHLYFSAASSGNSQLWRTDGTEPGTELVADINPGGASDPKEFLVFQDLLYFVATTPGGPQQLWRTDGTEGGTLKVTEEVIDARSLVIHNGLLYFVGQDSGGQFGLELWQSDGTSDGTTMVADINPGSDGIGESFEKDWLTSVGDDLFFIADDGVHGRELFVLKTTSSSLDELELSEGFSLSIFPNPASDYLTVSVDSNVHEGVTFEIYDIQGRLVQSAYTILSGANNVHVLKTGGLPAGIYLLKTELRDEAAISRVFSIVR